MGLLDFLSSDDGALGLGLLAAGGPTTDPNVSGFGARLAQGVGYARNARMEQMRNQLLQSQIDENQSQNLLRRAQIDRQARKDAYYLGDNFGFSAAPASAPASTSQYAAAAANGSTAGGAILKQAVGAPPDAPAPSQGKFAEWSKQFNIPIDALYADYFATDGKNISDMLFKAGRPDIQVANGYAYDKNTLRPGFLPALNTSQDGKSTLTLPDASGMPTVQPTPGALPTFNAFENAKNRSSASYTPGRPTILPGGRMGGQSQLDEIGGGPAATAPAAPTGRPLIGPGYVGGSASAAAGGQVDILQTELAKAQTEIAAAQQRGDAAGAARAQADVEGIQRELGRLPGGGSAGAVRAPVPLIGPGAGRGATNPAPAVPGGGLEFSPAEKAAAAAAQAGAVKQAEADVIPAQDKQKALNAGNDALRTIDKALNHPGLNAGTGWRGILYPQNYLPGTDAKNFAAVREQLHGQTFLQAYNGLKGGGQITEVEGTKAENAMARLDKTQSTEEFVSALKDLRDVVDRGLRLTRGEKVPDAPLPSNSGGKGPAVGAVDGGYRFRGGDPSKQSSWEKVQ